MYYTHQAERGETALYYYNRDPLIRQKTGGAEGGLRGFISNILVSDVIVGPTNLHNSISDGIKRLIQMVQ